MLIFRDLNVTFDVLVELTLRYVVFTGPARIFEQCIQRGVYSQSGVNIRGWCFYTNEQFNARSCRYKMHLKRI